MRRQSPRKANLGLRYCQQYSAAAPTPHLTAPPYGRSTTPHYCHYFRPAVTERLPNHSRAQLKLHVTETQSAWHCILMRHVVVVSCQFPTSGRAAVRQLGFRGVHRAGWPGLARPRALDSTAGTLATFWRTACHSDSCCSLSGVTGVWRKATSLTRYYWSTC